MVLQIVARRELPAVCSFCRVPLPVRGVVCFETDACSIPIVLLHDSVLQNSDVCRADLSGNLTLSKGVRNHRTWKKNWASASGIIFLLDLEGCRNLLLCSVVQAPKSES